MNKRCRSRDLRSISAAGSALKSSAALANRAGLISSPSTTQRMLLARRRALAVGADLYRVNLDAVVSKYIGETEKNLSALFDLAERGGWILFFDEADALFGKRSDVQDAHDRYANAEAMIASMAAERGMPILMGTKLSKADLASAGVEAAPRFRKWPP
jgi:ATPase family associated with various cellular activities (AAA)